MNDTDTNLGDSNHLGNSLNSTPHLAYTKRQERIVTRTRNTLACPMLGSGLSCGTVVFDVCTDCPDREK